MMYDTIISLENIYAAWREFKNNKRCKNDVALFSRNLDVHIYNLHKELLVKMYTHGTYKAFKINDPKPRDIHKAAVRDRLLHHAVYRILYPYFDKKFIYDSYSCRIGKGTHKAMDRFRDFGRIVSKNHTRTCFVLKCDVRKFFATIDHQILKSILEKHIDDENILWLLRNILDSFPKGLPLGNLTSQLLVNVYMNEFDQYMKHGLKVKYYVRYADDFVVLSEDKKYLEQLLLAISAFLEMKLKLVLHPDKVYIKTYASGVDFLGWIHFSNHRVLRTATKKRMFKNLRRNNYKKESIDSYAGMLLHGNAHLLSQKINVDNQS